MTAFRLTKWYVDVISDEGAAFIGYAARLTWGALRIGYASAILAECPPPSQGREKNRVAPPTTYTSLRGITLPEERGDEIAWTGANLGESGVRGTWRRLASPTTHTVYAGDQGAVHWDCRMPRANAIVHIGNVTLAGLGYAERLELTVLPWDMPIRELRWGRALASDHGVVWVDWRGDERRRHQFQVVHHGDRLLESCVIDDEGVQHQGARIVQFDPGTSLRTGALGKNVLNALPRTLGKRLPPLITATHEHKTLCPARLGEQRGWCIHEVVTFP